MSLSSPVNDYTSFYSYGNRTNLITIATDFVNPVAAWNSSILDAAYGANGASYGPDDQTGKSVSFTFDKAVCCSGFRFCNAGVDFGAKGFFQPRGSNDGVTWTNFGSPQQYITSSTGADGTRPGFLMEFANAADFLIYSIICTTAIVGSAQHMASEIEFKIKSSGYVGGNRTSLLTVTCSLGPTDVLGQAANEIVDGKLNNSGTEFGAQSNQLAWNGWSAGNYYQFQFPEAVAIDRAFFYTSSGAGSLSGNWKWMASDDGSTFTQSGTTFAIDTTNFMAPVQGPASGDAHLYWRLQSDTYSGSPRNWYEFFFDVPLPAPVAAVKPPIIIMMQ